MGVCSSTRKAGAPVVPGASSLAGLSDQFKTKLYAPLDEEMEVANRDQDETAERGLLFPGPLAPPGAQRRACLCRLWMFVGMMKMMFLGMVGMVLFFHPPPLPSSPTEVGRKLPSEAVFFDVQDLADNVPMAPAWYPDNLQGMFWLDSQGAYGHSDFKYGLNDAVMSFGDTQHSILDESRHNVYVSVTGPSWTWINNEEAYKEMRGQSWNSFFFNFNRDYNVAQIFASLHWAGRNWYGLGPNFASLPLLWVQSWLVKKNPPAHACPPEADASKEERSLCAEWDHVTCFAWCIGSRWGRNLPKHTPVWKVVDAHGKKVEPYFSALAEYVAERGLPNRTAAAEHGMILGKSGKSSSTLFHSVYVDEK